jgi:tetratricopeptide (TPR) repeat protein
MFPRAWILLLVLFLPYWGLAQVQLSTPLEILSFMEASGTKYEIEQLFGKLPPRSGPVLDHGVFIETRAGKSHEIYYSDLFSCAEEEAFLQAQKLFNREKPDYRKIRKLYQKILKTSPNNAQIFTLLGQTHLEQKEYSAARSWFEQALELNGVDYLAKWQLGELSWQQGDTAKAMDWLIQAHLLNRNHPRLIQRLRQLCQAQGFDYRGDWLFDPKYRLSQDSTGRVIIAADGVWLTYALYKAVWTYEPDYRFIKENQAVTDYLFQQEMEAALGTYLTYQQLRSQDQRQYPALHAFEKALDANMVEEYVMYEILMVERPELAYYLTEGFAQRLQAYVKKVRIQY